MGFIVKHSKGGAKGSDLTEELGVFFILVRTEIFIELTRISNIQLSCC